MGLAAFSSGCRWFYLLGVHLVVVPLAIKLKQRTIGANPGVGFLGFGGEGRGMGKTLELGFWR